jgi:transcription elongation factor GreA
MMDGKIPMTPEGNARLREELKVLKEVERPRISKEIGVAINQGDLSENAEYHAAKDRQGWIEARIKDLNDKLGRAEIIDPSKLSGSKVAFGARVKVSNSETEEETVYRLVGADEADLASGSISITSPLARALIGREVGDEVKVRMPAGERLYEILEVEYR